VANPRLSALAFAQRHLGQRLQSQGGLGGQCVDLVNVWLWEAYSIQPIQQNAIDWRNVTVQRHRWIVNSPINVPPRGAIVVWGQAGVVGIGQFGHIALNLTACGVGSNRAACGNGCYRLTECCPSC
jgi:hypothetical protein